MQKFLLLALFIIGSFSCKNRASTSSVLNTPEENNASTELVISFTPNESLTTSEFYFDVTMENETNLKNKTLREWADPKAKSTVISDLNLRNALFAVNGSSIAPLRLSLAFWGLESSPEQYRPESDLESISVSVANLVAKGSISETLIIDSTIPGRGVFPPNHIKWTGTVTITLTKPLLIPSYIENVRKEREFNPGNR